MATLSPRERPLNCEAITRRGEAPTGLIRSRASREFYRAYISKNGRYLELTVKSVRGVNNLWINYKT